LLTEQRPEGYWLGADRRNAGCDTIAYHHWNGVGRPCTAEEGVNHIFSKQLPDGGWNIYYGGPAEVNATIKATWL
jgi:squalene-hopene/tetraprenyl-beta-curcumene cyclase